MIGQIQLIGWLLAVVSFVMYVGRIWWKYGKQKSISISFYDLPYEKKGVFRLFIFSLCIGVALAGFNWWFLGAALCLSLVGILPRVKQIGKKVIHTIGAFSGITLAFTGLWFTGLWIPAVVFALGSIAVSIIDWQYKLWWIEILAFSLILINLLILIIR